MPRYLIEASHEPAECLETLDAFMRAGAHYLTNAEWGCETGIHTEWLIVEAENDADARLVIPPIIRKTALLVKLNKFSPDQIRELHQRESNEPGAGTA